MNLLTGRELRENWYEYNRTIELRVVLGPQEDAFTEKGLKTFLGNEYAVTNECDRMGYRLEGEKIEHKEGGDIISDGIAMGEIQIPHHFPSLWAASMVIFISFSTAGCIGLYR
ncbi:Allophanate hydrolase subunit 2 [Anaerovirgula multivorans]|uniref:Allophanate hydrolase subunit 2 n=1 Tax=Anaerovirgula multivorans TaxID=312168 RepID=A0A239IRJ4_9FIRM|nr:Allophanate hydrolase subunit 2 [Anaerovirgula multivorans]